MLKRFFYWLKSLFFKKSEDKLPDFKFSTEIRQNKGEIPDYKPYKMKLGDESNNQKIRNVEKHLRIARACENIHEKEVHISKAEKLIKRYHFPPLNRNPINA